MTGNKFIITIISIVIFLFLFHNVFIYDGLNKGIGINVFNQSYGLEIVGEPGFFIQDINE